MCQVDSPFLQSVDWVSSDCSTCWVTERLQDSRKVERHSGRQTLGDMNYTELSRRCIYHQRQGSYRSSLLRNLNCSNTNMQNSLHHFNMNESLSHTFWDKVCLHTFTVFYVTLHKSRGSQTSAVLPYGTKQQESLLIVPCLARGDSNQKLKNSRWQM